MSNTNFHPDFSSLQSAKTIWVAYSGGLDSHVLLQSVVAYAAQFQIQVRALHVHHGLNPNADAWTQHCKTICDNLKIPCEILRVNAQALPGESPEAAARTARYAAFEKWITHERDFLVTAHHQDDQAETVLLQWLRGAGLKGLAAMPQLANFSKGFIFRPFLSITRDALLSYATQMQLQWVDDDSNHALHFDRNYLRHVVMPHIRERWPAAAATLSRAAEHCAQADALLTNLAEEDLINVAGAAPQTLSISKLLLLKDVRRRNVIRHWLREKNFSTPSVLQMQQLENDLLLSAKDATPKMCWGNVELRRYQDDLYAMPRGLYDSINTLPEILKLDLENLPQLSGQQFIIHWQRGQGIRLLNENERNALHIRFRVGGERCDPVGRGGSHPLKKLFQEWKIAPWLRDQIPLIYTGDTLISVMGFCVSAAYAVEKDQMGWELFFTSPTRG